MSQQSTTRRRAKERRAQRRRQSNVRIMIGVGVAALVLAALLIVISLQGGDFDEIDYAGLPQSIDESYGGLAYALGEPDAPVTLVDYSDFSCSYCRRFAPVVHTMIDEYVRDGRLRVVYVPVSIVNPASEPASAALICAGEQGKAWDMHDGIWALGGPTSYNRDRFIGLAEDLELDVDLFAACYDSPETMIAVQEVNSAAAGRGITGTPTVFVNDTNIPNVDASQMEGVLRQAIEAELQAQQ